MEDPCKLADSDDLVPRQIRDRRLADDRRHVMLAMRLEGDVLQQHDLVISADLFEGAVEMYRRVLGVPLGIFAPSAGDSARRVEQPFAVGIVTRPADQRADCLLHLLRNFTCLRRFDEIAVFGLAMIEGRVHFASSCWMSAATSAACSRISGTAMISQ